MGWGEECPNKSSVKTPNWDEIIYLCAGPSPHPSDGTKKDESHRWHNK